MNIQHWWNDGDRAKLKYLGKNPVPTQLFPPQIPYNDLGLNLGLFSKRCGSGSIFAVSLFTFSEVFVAACKWMVRRDNRF
jgi:hypothetical protein